jgi:glycosyltransferase involved in cell wall biosynthesis
VVRSLAVGHRDRGHTVRVAAVVSNGRSDHPFVASLEECGIETVRIAIPDGAYFREGVRVAELCRRHRPSVVHTHGFRPDVVDATVARRLGIPTITTVHGFASGGWKLRMYERVQWFAFRRFDAVVAVSRPLAERLAERGVRRDRLHLVPNAYFGPSRMLDRVAARRRLGIPENQFVIGWVGRLSPEKGADVLVDAMARLPSIPMNVAILGDGPQRSVLTERAAAFGVSGHITWHGVVRDAACLFTAFDVFVLSSRTEGVPIVLLEAMAASVPIVATRVGGVPDMLSPHEAVLVPPEDPAGLAEGVMSIYRDPGRAARYASAARERLVSGFDADRWLTRYEMLYEDIQRPAGTRP